MYKLSKMSQKRLDTCHPKLQEIVNDVLKFRDISVLCGHRTKAEQEAAFITKHSKLRWPKSKHNSLPSLAIDIAPYPIDWKDTKGFHALAKLFLSIAHEKGIKIRWGGDFNMDGDKTKNDAWDLPHFELVDY